MALEILPEIVSGKNILKKVKKNLKNKTKTKQNNDNKEKKKFFLVHFFAIL